MEESQNKDVETDKILKIPSFKEDEDLGQTRPTFQDIGPCSGDSLSDFDTTKPVGHLDSPSNEVINIDSGLHKRAFKLSNLACETVNPLEVKQEHFPTPESNNGATPNPQDENKKSKVKNKSPADPLKIKSKRFNKNVCI